MENLNHTPQTFKSCLKFMCLSSFEKKILEIVLDIQEKF